MPVADLISHISRHINLSETEVDQIKDSFSSRRFLKGQYPLQGGDICRHLHFVTKGSLKTFFVDLNGSEQVLNLAVEDWWVVDQASFVYQTPSMLDIQCLEVTHLLSVSKSDLDLLLTEIPKLERFFRIIIQRHLINTQKRLIENLCLSATDRYLNFIRSHRDLEQRFPQFLIASYLGMSKEFLSKIRRELALSGE